MSEWDGLALLVSNVSQSAGGTLTMADIEALETLMWNTERQAVPRYDVVSPREAKLAPMARYCINGRRVLRIERMCDLARLYEANAMPQRLLRKTVKRKVQARIERGRRRIEHTRRAEEQRLHRVWKDACKQ